MSSKRPTTRSNKPTGDQALLNHNAAATNKTKVVTIPPPPVPVERVKRRVSEDFSCQASTLSDFVLQRATCSTDGFRILQPRKKYVLSERFVMKIPPPQMARVEGPDGTKLGRRSSSYRPDGYTQKYLSGSRSVDLH